MLSWSCYNLCVNVLRIRFCLKLCSAFKVKSVWEKLIDLSCPPTCLSSSFIQSTYIGNNYSIINSNYISSLMCGCNGSSESEGHDSNFYDFRSSCSNGWKSCSHFSYYFTYFLKIVLQIHKSTINMGVQVSLL
jgi:hypothetical protein